MSTKTGNDQEGEIYNNISYEAVAEGMPHLSEDLKNIMHSDDSVLTGLSCKKEFDCEFKLESNTTDAPKQSCPTENRVEPTESR